MTATPASNAGEDLMVVARKVRKSFGGFDALRGVDLDVPRSQVVCLIGPSGSGKSTFLRCVNHLERVDGGRIYVAGELVGYRVDGGKLREAEERELCRRRSRIGMVFQRFNLFPHMTAIENVMEAPVHVLGHGKREAREEAAVLLERVGLSDKAGAYPSALSGGQQQRVGIARALAMQPQLMLFDEPTSALDPELVGEVLDVMRDLAGGGMTMIVVTHEMAFAREVADKVVLMDEGQVVDSGPPKEFFDNPAHERSQAFLSKVL